MDETAILKELFDEKILKVLDALIANPEKKFYLSEISSITGVNISTAFRILNKLIEQQFVKMITMGKIRFYQFNKNEKTLSLLKMLKKEEVPMQEFIEKIKMHPRVKKVILESSGKKEANVIIVGDFLPQDRISKISDEIKMKYDFKINAVEISEKQFESLRKFGHYEFDNKIIFERKSSVY